MDPFLSSMAIMLGVLVVLLFLLYAVVWVIETRWWHGPEHKDVDEYIRKQRKADKNKGRTWDW